MDVALQTSPAKRPRNNDEVQDRAHTQNNNASARPHPETLKSLDKPTKFQFLQSHSQYVNHGGNIQPRSLIQESILQVICLSYLKGRPYNCITDAEILTFLQNKQMLTRDDILYVTRMLDEEIKLDMSCKPPVEKVKSFFVSLVNTMQELGILETSNARSKIKFSWRAQQKRVLNELPHQLKKAVRALLEFIPDSNYVELFNAIKFEANRFDGEQYQQNVEDERGYVPQFTKRQSNCKPKAKTTDKKRNTNQRPTYRRHSVDMSGLQERLRAEQTERIRQTIVGLGLENCGTQCNRSYYVVSESLNSCIEFKFIKIHPKS